MSAVGSVQGVRDLLEPFAFSIGDTSPAEEDTAEISAELIEKILDLQVKTYIEDSIGMPLGSVESKSEYISVPVAARKVLLPFRGPEGSITLTEVVYVGNNTAPQSNSYTFSSQKGMLIKTDSSYFIAGSGNLKVSFNIGLATIPDAIHHAANLIAAAFFLVYKEGIDGNALSISVVSYSESYGADGKYHKQYDNWYGEALAILQRYMTSVL